ncbi:tetratricopeptide repeat protein, partial [Coleofasciculus sp.]|uniref:tetratricopeptide repeat protein n=1 Tax=Coleofasciculus sp. TaxID=3100458 RepID=UPI0039F8D267
VRSANFSPDGQRIVTASDDKTARVWRAGGLDSLLAQGCDWLNQHLIFNPQDLEKLAVCQTPANKTAAAKFWLYQGETQARQGNIQPAVELFRKVLAWNPKFNLNPQQKAEQLAEASELVAQGEAAAQEGNIQDAVTAFNRARELDPSLKFNPEIRAREIATSTLVEQGKSAVREGKIEEAVTVFNRARELDPSLEFKPETKAASLLVERGQRLADDGQITEAFAAYTQAQTLDSTVEIPAQSWKNICKIGSINGDAQDVILACEKAVKIASENDRPNYQDSRGLARALTGDSQGAIEDFQVHIDWINIEKEKSQPQSRIDFREDILAERQDWIDYLEKIKVQRQGWIEALKAGENPFTPEELESLRNE